MQKFSKRKVRMIAGSLAGLLALSACATPTPYQPAMGRGSSANGYTDQRIEADRYQVSFSGNTLTSRETVERYLLFRAAQLTLEQGYDYFELADRDTERQTRTYVNDFGPRFGGYGAFGGYWGPGWRYHRPGFGWAGWSPFWGDPFWGNNIDVRTVDRYEAFAEVVLGRGQKPDNVRAFDARQVIENLGPTIQLPQGGR